jgi:ParB/RepB/Spo0J family partition protein
MSKSYTADIPVHLIDDPIELLRPVDQRGVEYLELKQSIAKEGILNSILVRPRGDRYQAVDGMHRLTIARQLQHESIPARVCEMTDDESRLAQLKTAVNRIECQPVFIARRIERLLIDNPSWTLNEISVRISKNPYWIKQRLELLHLNNEHQKLVDSGKLTVGNAHLLVRLPEPLRDSYLEHALTLTNSDFELLAGPVVKAYREDVSQERREAMVGPMKPCMRSVVTIQSEIEKPTVAGPLTLLDACETPVDGFASALRWVLRMDSMGEQTRRVRQVTLEAKRIKSITQEEKKNA